LLPDGCVFLIHLDDFGLSGVCTIIDNNTLVTAVGIVKKFAALLIKAFGCDKGGVVESESVIVFEECVD
jgi:hypothetical protein